MFTYVGLSEKQVAKITSSHHVYMLKSGRISISGCKRPIDSDFAYPYEYLKPADIVNSE